MPSHIPRVSPARKKEQLLNCSEYLRLAIFHKKSNEQIQNRAEKYRLAQISILKAKLHVLKGYSGEQEGKKEVQLNSEMEYWTTVSLEEIISDFTQTKGLV